MPAALVTPLEINYSTKHVEIARRVALHHRLRGGIDLGEFLEIWLKAAPADEGYDSVCFGCCVWEVSREESEINMQVL